jgi:hypothetical protein
MEQYSLFFLLADGRMIYQAFYCLNQYIASFHVYIILTPCSDVHVHAYKQHIKGNPRTHVLVLHQNADSLEAYSTPGYCNFFVSKTVRGCKIDLHLSVFFPVQKYKVPDRSESLY